MIFAAALALASVPARADWLATANGMGLFGRFSVGVIREWSPVHSTELSVGFYGDRHRDRTQWNFAYRYSPWRVDRPGGHWTPVQGGIFAVRSADDRTYFSKSPDRYPTEDYYDPTILRLGVELGSAVTFGSIEAAYHVRLLDVGVVALSNNPGRSLPYLLSSGAALRWRF